MKIENGRGEPIATLADWQRLAPPAAAVHWREYRSAFELAHAWTEGDGADRLLALLTASDRFAGARLERAIAERKTSFDDIPGGPRNHDLLVLGSAIGARFVVGIEAKADETFDRDLISFRTAARRRQPDTRALERLDRLTRACFGLTLDEDPTLGALRYQLLAALAGTLAEARRFRATVAVLAVHEFATPETDPAKQRRNGRDLEAFVARLGPAAPIASDQGEWLAGPYAVPGNAHLPAEVAIYVAKLHTTVAPRLTSTSTRHGATPADNHRISKEPAMLTPERAKQARRPTRMAIPAGASVIKLNVHPLGCPCSCARNLAFVVNRPGRNPRQNVKTPRLDNAIGQVRDWALDVIYKRDTSYRNPTSTFDVGGGMTTITLAVHPGGVTPRFIVRHWDTGATIEPGDLDTAIEQIAEWVRHAA